jgi:hypothetical protein
MDQLPFIALVIYLFAFFGGALIAIYGYFQWKRYGKKRELVWGAFGGLLLLNIAWGLFVRHLIISGTGNASYLDLSRKALILLTLLAGAILWMFRNHISWLKE